jgi:short-subunit dehydrogenase
VILVSRTLAKLQKVDIELNKINNKIQTRIVQADFTGNSTKKYYNDLYLEILSKVPANEEISLVVNNAGIMNNGLFNDLPLKDLTDMIDVNVTHQVMLTKRFVNYFNERRDHRYKGGIINVSSSIGYIPSAGSAVYSATKACINYFTVASSYELKDKLDIQCLTPSLTETNLLEGNVPSFTWLFPARRLVSSSLSQMGNGQYITGGHLSHDL